MRTINISEEGFLKFMAIKKSRPQDTSRAQTFDHIIYIYEEQQFKTKPRTAMDLLKEKKDRDVGNTSPIIDAEKANKNFIQLKERMDVL
jgi:hypothetical protein